jgi:hypothetical protein
MLPISDAPPLGERLAAERRSRITQRGKRGGKIRADNKLTEFSLFSEDDQGEQVRN